MLQQSASQKYTDEHLKEKFYRPKRFDVFFHAVKTFKLIGALIVDGRVPVVRKVLFLGSIAALVAVLFFPDLVSEAFLSTVLPIVGTVLGVPLDAGFDWIAFALVIVSLLRYFPSDIVSEHYMSIFDK